MLLSLRTTWVALVALLLAGPASLTDCQAEPPQVTQLLPEETLLLVRIPSGKELADRFEQTSLGRMKNDPRVQPLIQSLLGSAREALKLAEEELGISPLETLSLLEGELSFALIGSEDRRPAPALIVDLPTDTAVLDKLVEKAITALADSGATQSSEEIAGTTATVFDLPQGNRKLVWLRFEGRLLICEGRETAELLLNRAKETPEKSLATNNRYAAIMNRCKAGESSNPQVILFADPIGLARGFATGNSQLGVGLAFLPALGLDGLQGVGGTLALATESFDQVLQGHLLLDNPRQGVLKMLALRSGSAEPPRWVPANAATYLTFRWDLRTTYDTLGTLVDNFQGAGAFAGQVQRRVSEQIGLDFEADVLASLTGRVTVATVFEQPARLDSRASLWALELKDGAEFKAILEKIVANERFQLEPQEFRGVTYYEGQPRRRRGELDPAENAPRPGIAIVENMLLLADRTSVLQAALTAQQGTGSLADGLDYKLIVSRLGRQPGGEQPVLLAFSRPEEQMRHWLDLAGTEETRAQLERQAERLPAAKALLDVITSGKLPPAAVLKEYLAPSGSLLTDDETGLHYTALSLKRK